MLEGGTPDAISLSMQTQTSNDTIGADFDGALAAYVALLNTAEAQRHTREGYKFDPTKYSIDPNGKKYIRIVADAMGLASHRSVHVFVEKSTGLIWKADGWKKPALNFSRGSIYAIDKSGDALLKVGR